MNAMDDWPTNGQPDPEKDATVTELDERRRSIEEATEHADKLDEERPAVPEPPPLQGSAQMTLAGLAPKNTPVDSVVSIMSKEAPIRGLIEQDVEVQLLVTVRVNKYEYVPVREDGEVTRYKLRQQLRIIDVVQAGSEAAQARLAGTA